MLSIFVKLPPRDPDYDDVFDYIEGAFKKVTEETGLGFRFLRQGEDFRQTIKQANIIIIDVSHQWESMLYELGFAHALKIPTVILCQKDRAIPVNIPDEFLVEYDRNRLKNSLTPSLSNTVITIIAGPDEILAGQEPTSRSYLMKKGDDYEASQLPHIFIGYTQSDEKYVDVFLKSMNPLREDKLCNVWTEKNILPGMKRAEARQDALMKAVAAVIFLSNSYLDSPEWKTVKDYVLQTSETGNIRLILVIVDAFTFPSYLDEFIKKNDLETANPLPVKPLESQASDSHENKLIYQRVTESIKNLLTNSRLGSGHIC